LLGSEQVTTFEAGSHVEAMTIYDRLFGRGAYTTDQAWDHDLYPETWAERQRTAGNADSGERSVTAPPSSLNQHPRQILSTLFGGSDSRLIICSRFTASWISLALPTGGAACAAEETSVAMTMQAMDLDMAYSYPIRERQR
jgi:hypothetical protein